MLRDIFTESLARGKSFDYLRALVTQHPGRLAGSKSLAGAVLWAEQTLTGLGLDRVHKQEVTVPHWERGEKEAVMMLSSTGEVAPLNAVALGGSVATPKSGLTAEVVEVKSLDEVVTLGHAKISGKIVFFNRPMDPVPIRTGTAYSGAGDQRSRGPARAAHYGAVAAAHAFGLPSRTTITRIRAAPPSPAISRDSRGCALPPSPRTS